ncbi:MAG: type II toxin-antitoxin system VapC family toxin [Rubrivivax sp.]|nr:type II toxin-antitoxin system VapC family toxin [Pyrinomonadaceae bacterium]
MPPITFDTSVFKSYKPVDFPAGFLFSAVVIQEMMASANDNSEMKRWAAAWRAYEEEDRLIVPTSADWLMASKVLYWLMQKRKKKAGGKSPPLKSGASQRMALDALIAASARSSRAVVVTVNYSDFEAIQYYFDVEVIKASDYFGR